VYNRSAKTTEIRIINSRANSIAVFLENFDEPSLHVDFLGTREAMCVTHVIIIIPISIAEI